MNNNHKKLEQKKITKEVNNALLSNFNITNANNVDFKNINYSWDDLNKLKNDIGMEIIKFIMNVNELLQNKEVLDVLSNTNKRDEFDKLTITFFKDINKFTETIKEISDQHLDKSGKIDNIDDFDVYNRLAIKYHVSFTEFTSLISPLIASIMLLLAEANNTTSKPEIINNVQ